MNVPIEEVSRRLADRALDVCRHLLPGGSKVGREYHASNTTGGAGSSLKVTLEGPKAGLWKDWGGKVGGDMIALFQHCRGHPDRFKACDEARAWAGIPPFERERTGGMQNPANRTPVPSRQNAEPVSVEPASANAVSDGGDVETHGPPVDPKTVLLHGRPPDAVYTYCDLSGEAMGHVLRWNPPGEDKVVRPCTIDGRLKGWWPSDCAPLYGLELLTSTETRNVLLVEGEKATHIARLRFPHFLVLTWIGGVCRVDKVDLAPLIAYCRASRVRVVFWPDNDLPGQKAMITLRNRLGEVAAGIVQLPPGLPKGWDLADPRPPSLALEAINRAVEEALRIERASAVESDPLPGNDDPPSRGEDIRPFTVWPPSRFLEWVEPPGYRILPEGRLARAQTAAIIGAPGTGKSFVILACAIASILHRPCLGIPWREPDWPIQRWLLLGDENSIARLKDDLTIFKNVLSDEEFATVDANLRLQALDVADDGNVILDGPEQAKRLSATIAGAFLDGPPTNVAVDPLGNYADGDLNKAPVMDGLLRVLKSAMRTAKAPGALFVLHHGSADAMTIASAVTVNGANYSANSRRLVAHARLVINLFRIDDRRIVVQCGKLNDGRAFPLAAFDFNTNPFGERVRDFDIGTWLDEKRGKSSREACSLDDVIEAVRGGARRTDAIVRAVRRRRDCSERSVKRRLDDGVADGALERVARGQYALGPKFDGAAS